MKVRNSLAIVSGTLGLMLASSIAAQSVTLDIALPQLDVAEYHKPYVAVWIENSKRKSTQVAVWYDVDMREHEGKEWLKDLRQWWRRGGRSLGLPYDGLTSATKGPGAHVIDTQLNGALAQLSDGDYTLRIEASREVGGREVISIPFSLPISAESLPVTLEGKSEIGRVSLRLEDE